MPGLCRSSARGRPNRRPKAAPGRGEAGDPRSTSQSTVRASPWTTRTSPAPSSAASSTGQEVTVDLERDDRRAGLEERERQRPDAGADLEHAVPRPDLRQPGDAAGGVGIGEEVLSERATRTYAVLVEQAAHVTGSQQRHRAEAIAPRPSIRQRRARLLHVAELARAAPAADSDLLLDLHGDDDLLLPGREPGVGRELAPAEGVPRAVEESEPARSTTGRRSPSCRRSRRRRCGPTSGPRASRSSGWSGRPRRSAPSRWWCDSWATPLTPRHLLGDGSRAGATGRRCGCRPPVGSGPVGSRRRRCRAPGLLGRVTDAHHRVRRARRASGWSRETAWPFVVTKSLVAELHRVLVEQLVEVDRGHVVGHGLRPSTDERPLVLACAARSTSSFSRRDGFARTTICFAPGFRSFSM